MEIILYRYIKTSDSTKGELSFENKKFGWTLEPPLASLIRENKVSALPEGTYSVLVKTNPMAGTPCIKIIGKNVPANASIRCYPSSSKNNPSITLLSSEDSKSDDKENNCLNWANFLKFILENKSVSLLIK